MPVEARAVVGHAVLGADDEAPIRIEPGVILVGLAHQGPTLVIDPDLDVLAKARDLIIPRRANLAHGDHLPSGVDGEVDHGGVAEGDEKVRELRAGIALDRGPHTLPEVSLGRLANVARVPIPGGCRLELILVVREHSVGHVDRDLIEERDGVGFLPVVIGGELHGEHAGRTIGHQPDGALASPGHAPTIERTHPACAGRRGILEGLLDRAIEILLQVDGSGDLVHHRGVLLKGRIVGVVTGPGPDVGQGPHDLPDVPLEAVRAEL